MPDYIYKCAYNHYETQTHRMLYSTGIVCGVCNTDMRRVPQVVTVTWGGLAPSAGDMHPNIRGLINDAPEKRAEFDGIHEEHEREQ